MPTEENSSIHKQYHFSVYIDSTDPKSASVVERLKSICSTYLSDAYAIDVYDLHDELSHFKEKQIIAIPTIDIKNLGKHYKRFIGDLSNTEKIIKAISARQYARESMSQAIITKKESKMMMQEALEMYRSTKGTMKD